MTKSVRCPIATMGWGASIAMAIMATHGDYYVTNPAKVGVALFGLKFHPHVTLEFGNGGWNSRQPSVFIPPSIFGGILTNGVIDFSPLVKNDASLREDFSTWESQQLGIDSWMVGETPFGEADFPTAPWVQKTLLAVVFAGSVAGVVPGALRSRLSSYPIELGPKNWSEVGGVLSCRCSIPAFLLR